jgi:outer membrane protein TolC
MTLSSFPGNRSLRSGGFVLLLALGCLLVGRLPADAQKPPEIAAQSKKKVLTLEQAIAIALKNNPEIKESRAGVLGAKAKKSQADAARYPQLDALAVLGPSPRARGSQVFSPNRQSDPTISGVFARGIFTLIQPIFTFGEISGLRRAASSNIKLEEARVEEKSSEIVVKVKEFYFGYLAAKDLLSLAEEVKGQLDDAKKKVRTLLDKDSDTVDEVDLYKLEAFTSVVDDGVNEAKKSVILALGALKFSMGVPSDEQFELADKHLFLEVRPVEKLPYYQAKSSVLRPEFRQVSEGLKALQALVDVEKSKYFPKFFLGGLWDIAEASNRDDIENPFVIDPLNHNVVGVVVGFKWHFDLGITAGRVSEAQAEYQKVLHKKTFAEQGIPLQVKQAYEDLREAAKNIKSTENSYKFARKWMVAAVANFDLGIDGAEEIFKALEQYAKTRAENYKQILAYNMALARLDQTSGLAMKIVRKNGN